MFLVVESAEISNQTFLSLQTVVVSVHGAEKDNGLKTETAEVPSPGKDEAVEGEWRTKVSPQKTRAELRPFFQLPPKLDQVKAKAFTQHGIAFSVFLCDGDVKQGSGRQVRGDGGVGGRQERKGGKY